MKVAANLLHKYFAKDKASKMTGQTKADKAPFVKHGVSRTKKGKSK